MFTAEFRRRGQDAILVPMHVVPEDFDRCIPRLLEIRNLGGLIFTIPYKARACTLAHELGSQASIAGAINALARCADGTWKGEIFDGQGCVEAFRRRGWTFAGKRAMVIGAGGAGSAIALAIAYERPAAMHLFDIDATRVQALADKIHRVDPHIAVEIAVPRWDDVDILLNASPIGMLEDPRMPIEATALPSTLIVFDAIVKPERTRLLALAEASGCRTIPGSEMMRGQIEKMVEFFGF